MAGSKNSLSTGQKTTYIDNSGNKQAGYTAPAASPAAPSAAITAYANYIAQHKAARQAAQTPAAAPATTYTDVLVNQQRATQTPAASNTQAAGSGGTIQAQKTTYPLAANETPQATTLPRTTTEAPQVTKLAQHKASNFDNTLAKSQQAAAASTPNGAVQTTYTDAQGNTRTGWIINGKTYTDAAGTQEVPVGAYVTDASGRVWRKGYGNDSTLVSSPLEEDHYDYMTGVGNTKSLEFTTPDGYSGYVVANPDKGIYYVEDSQHHQIGYIDSAGVYHSAYYDSDYDKAMAASAKQAAASNGYQFNGSGVVKIASGQDLDLERTFLINQYADALDRGEDGADILRQLGYTGPVTEGVRRTGGQGAAQVAGAKGTTQGAAQGTQTLTSTELTGTQGANLGAGVQLGLPATGGAQEYSSALQDLQTQLEQVDFALEQAKALNDELRAQQLEQVRARIQEQIATLNEQYQSLNRQLYVDYMKSRRDLPQLLAAQGYTGGLRESSMLGLETAYGENLAQNERERMSGIRSIEAGGLDNELTLAIENAKAQQDAEDRAYERAAKIRAAMIEQRNYEDKQERETQEKNRQLAQQQINAYLSAGGDPAGIPADLLAISGLSSTYVGAIAADVQRQRELEEQQRQRQWAQEDRARAQNQVNSYLTAGVGTESIPADLLAASGYDTAYIDALAGKQAAATAEPKLTAAQVNDAIKKGNLTPQVLADYEYYYGAPYQTAAPAATPSYTPTYNPTPSPVPSVTPASIAAGVKNIIKNGGAYAYEDAADYAYAYVANGLIDEDTAAAIVADAMKK